MASWGRSRGPHVEGRGPLGHAAPLDEVQQAAHRVHPAPALGRLRGQHCPNGVCAARAPLLALDREQRRQGVEPGALLGGLRGQELPHRVWACLCRLLSCSHAP